jgi:hypothetical protein
VWFDEPRHETKRYALTFTSSIVDTFGGPSEQDMSQGRGNALAYAALWRLRALYDFDYWPRRRGSRSKRDPPAPCDEVGWPLRRTRASQSLRGRPTSSRAGLARGPRKATRRLWGIPGADTDLTQRGCPPKRHRVALMYYGGSQSSSDHPRSDQGSALSSSSIALLSLSFLRWRGRHPWKELESPEDTDSNYSRVLLPPRTVGRKY